MLRRDDPKVYRHPSNAHPGQANSPLATSARYWTKGRITVRRGALFTEVVPEAYIERPIGGFDPETGVPFTEGEWQPLTDANTGRQTAIRVLGTLIPGSKLRTRRAVAVLDALFRARAVWPEVVD